MSRLRVCLGLALLALAGCGGHLARGVELYGEHEYVEAAHVFERTERRLPELSPSDQAEYGLYRALTYVALGDVNGARHWLLFAYSVERAHPGSLTPSGKAAADRAWFDHVQRTGPPGEPDSALAAQGIPATAPATPLPASGSAEPRPVRSLVP